VRDEGTVSCNSWGWTHPELFDSVDVGWGVSCLRGAEFGHLRRRCPHNCDSNEESHMA